MTAQPTDKERIFTAALELADPAERRAYLEAACGQDRQLLAQVESLLKHDEEAGSFIERPAAASPGTVDFRPVTEGPGTVIGPYKILQKIGEGGFGVVYMAEQQHPVRRKVALKIIKPGMDTREVIARFESERQALALMDHPNIARVLDAGATDSGRPYFVMELVKGVPITEYCDKNNLPTEKRLELFLAVCHAVQHAHQKGIIHRDIKPSNVMVTLHDGKPVPKVIDFGVAKATSQQLTEKTLFTAYGQMIGTPVYMSPEQAEMSGLDIDTRSDIYSLGVLLYELLTGTTPFDGKRLRDAGYVEMQRIIREEEPPRPSTRVSTMGAALTVLSNQRSTDPGKLRQLLRGDLDLIVMKALEKERTRRYETPSSFAQDVERFLNHEAILARPQSSLYRLRKFAQRNKAAVASGTAIAAALLLGTLVSTLMAIQAYNQRNHARDSLAALHHEQTKTEEERRKAVNEAKRAVGAELLLAEQKRLADKRAKEAEESRATESELRKNADDKRRAIEQQSSEIAGLNDQLRRSMEDQRRAIYAAEMNLVRLEAQRGNLPRMRELLMKQIPGADDEDLRGWEWTYWYRFLHRAEVVFRYEGFVYDKPDSALAVAPGGKRAAATRGERTEWIDLASQKVIGAVPVRLRLNVNRTPLAANGRLADVYAVSQAAYWPAQYRLEKPTQVDVWEATGEKRVFKIPENSMKLLTFVHLSPSGNRLAAVGNDVSQQSGQPACRLLVWDIDSGDLLLNQVEQRELNRLALSHDGTLLTAWVCHSTRRHRDELREVAAVFDVATGQVLGTARHNDDVDAAFLLPDCQRVLLSTLGFSGSNRKDLLLWNIASQTPERLTTEMMPDYVKGAVSPDGRLFAVSGHSVSKVRVFEIDGGRLIATLHNEATTIESLTFTADSQQLIASSTSGEVLRWDLNQDSDLFQLRGNPLGSLAHSGFVVSLDQSLLAYVTATGSVRVRALDGTEKILDPGNPDAMRGSAQLAFSADGSHLAFATDVNPAGSRLRGTQAVELYEIAQSRRVWRWVPLNNTTIQRLLFTGDNQHLLLEPVIGPIIRLDCASGKVAPLPSDSDRRVYARVWASPAGQMLVAARTPEFSVSGNVKVIVRDLLTGQAVGETAFPTGARQYDLVGSPDGKHLAIRRLQPDYVEIWNFRESRLVQRLPGNVIVFSSDGRLAAIGETQPTVAGGIAANIGGILRVTGAQVWNMESLQLINSISLAGNHADALRFSPDGRRLLTLHGLQALGVGGAIPEVRLWDIAWGREIMSIPVAEVNHYMWDAYYDDSGNRLTVLVLSKSAGTGGGWGSTVLDATPLSKSEDAELVARRRVKDMLSKDPLPADAIAAVEADGKLDPLVRAAALAMLRLQPASAEALADFCIDSITQFEAAPEQRQVAMRCAQALLDIEPSSLRSRVLLSGALLRAGLPQEALTATQPLASVETATLDEQDQVFAACQEGICALAEQQLGNVERARPHAARLFDATRKVASTASSNQRSLFYQLTNETTFFVGSARPVPPPSGQWSSLRNEDFLSRVFDRLDRNHDGQLEQQETGSPVWTDLLIFDVNGDGQLTKEEFIRANQARSEIASREPASSLPALLPYEQRLAAQNAALEKDPNNATALANRARLLSACPDDRIRDGKQALLDATKACELTKGQNPLFFATLAMAHANLGDFDAAVKCQEQALAEAPPALRDDLITRLELYREQKPFRLPGRYEAIAGWGRSVDPLGDCEVVADAGTLRIKVPGSMHNLHPLARGMDAPRVLREVEGDFTVEVRVTCAIQPRNALPDTATTYNGAGLLVFADAENFLRVERDGFFIDQAKYPNLGKTGFSPLSSNGPTVEYWRDGRMIDYYADWSATRPQLPGESTWLRIERRGAGMRVLLSHDGQEWKEVQSIVTTFPAGLQVGVAAVNSSADSFQAEFSNFKLSQP